MGSKSACHFLFSRQEEGPTVEGSPCCGLGAREGRGAGAAGLEVHAQDLRAGGGASCYLKLTIYEENIGEQS